MEDNSSLKSEEKPFSVLARFRQLKKEKEQVPATVENVKPTEPSGTVFQASTSTSNGGCGKVDGFQNRGKPHGKRYLSDDNSDSPERNCKRIFSAFHQGQKEKDVGITEYIRDGPGFQVIIKHRYTDFLVNEIDKGGRVIRLTSTDIPVEEVVQEPVTDVGDPTIMSPEQWATLEEIVEKKLPNTVEIDVTDYDKEKRQRVHKAVKRRFGVHVYSNTKEIDSRKVIQIGIAQNETNKRFCTWPKGRPEYLHFVLLKENADTTEVINVLSKHTYIKVGRFGFAGTKDKRSVTTQQMSVRRGDPERFRKCSKLRGIKVGNYCYKWNPLRLGDLSGNRFKIALRNVKASDEVITDAIEHLKTSGFINYFGMQRFGQSALVPTYSIGKAILQGDWKLAIELVLKPRPGESSYPDIKEAREIWWETKDAAKGLKPLTRKDKSIEGKILLGLKKHGPRAYQNAFDNLPKQNVTMYVHAYQSLIWNKIVSRRISEFGLKVLPGDLVKVPSWLIEDTDPKSEDSGESEEEDEEKDEEDEEAFKARIQVRSLGVAEAETISIFDVLYPLPGDKIRLPDNEVAKWYNEYLKEDGFTLESFRTVNKKYGMHGSYRNIMQRTEDLSWHTVHYTNPDEDLLHTDMDVLKGKPAPTFNPDGPYKALIIEFNLNSSCYATMVIRELTKCDTSSSSQALLTSQAWEEYERYKRQKLASENQKQNQEMQTEGVESNLKTEGKDECMLGFCTTLNINDEDLDEKGKEEMAQLNAEADNLINFCVENKFLIQKKFLK